MSRHFLFAMWEGGGNVSAMLGLARRLIARGHRVSVLGDPTIADEATRGGCGFMSWRRAPHRKTLRPEDDLLRDWESPNAFAMLRTYRDRFIAIPAPDYAADTLEAIDATAPDVLVPEFTLFGATMAAQARGLPVAAIVPNIWPIPVPGVPPFGPGFAPPRTWLGRARDALVLRLVLAIFAGGLPSLNATRRTLGLPPLATFFDQVLTATAVFVQSSPTFDYSSRAVPANVHYIGPMLDDPDWAAPWTMPWPTDNEDPFVLVGFSSTFQDQAAALRNVVRALAPMRVRALVTLGEMLDADQVPSQGAVVVLRSAPHRALLRHAALLITHCGHGTTLKGLAAGVPILCMPMGRDQNDTAARVVHAGAGLRLSPRASARTIAAAVRRLLEDDRYRANANRLREALAREAAACDPAEALERVAEPPARATSART